MQPRETWLQADLRKPAQVQALRGVIFSQDNQGDLVGVEVYDGGAPVALSGSVMGYIVKDNGETVGVPGQCSENRAWIVLPANAYDVVGMLHIAIQWKESSADTSPALTLGMCAVYVQRTRTGDIVTPEYRILDVAAILQMISDVTAATTAANTAADNANAKASLANTAATNANTKATLADQKATLANTAAEAANAAAAAAPTVLTATTQYKVADSGSTTPSAWDNDPPATVPQGKWLWIKQTLAWDNGQTSTLYTKAYQGQDGAGAVSTISLGGIVYTADSTTHDVALPLDTAPTQNSSALLTSGAVYTAVEDVSDAVEAVSDAVNAHTPIVVDFSTATALPATVNDAAITADMQVIGWEATKPLMIASDLTVTTANGSVTVDGTLDSDGTGGIGLKIYLAVVNPVTYENEVGE